MFKKKTQKHLQFEQTVSYNVNFTFWQFLVFLIIIKKLYVLNC